MGWHLSHRDTQGRLTVQSSVLGLPATGPPSGFSRSMWPSGTARSAPRSGPASDWRRPGLNASGVGHGSPRLEFQAHGSRPLGGESGPVALLRVVLGG